MVGLVRIESGIVMIGCGNVYVCTCRRVSIAISSVDTGIHLSPTIGPYTQTHTQTQEIGLRSRLWSGLEGGVRVRDRVEVRVTG